MTNPICQHKLFRIRELILLNKKKGEVTTYDLKDNPLVCGIPKSYHGDTDEYSENNFGHVFEGCEQGRGSRMNKEEKIHDILFEW